MPNGKQTDSALTHTPANASSREWNIFAYHSFARIVARKHGLVPPELDFSSLSDEEVEVRLRMVQELAHLPPA